MLALDTHGVRITLVVCLFVTGYQTFIIKALDDGGSVEQISNISTEFKNASSRTPFPNFATNDATCSEMAVT